jgi:hypothetical protein
MCAFSPDRVINLWESGRSLHPLDKGVLALRMSLPDASGDVADWPLGRRNLAIARLRRDCFGAELRAQTKCPRCAEPVEFALDADALIATGEPQVEAVSTAGAMFRLPTSRILASVVDEPDADVAAARLCENCRIDGPQGEGAGSALSTEDIERLGDALALADPLAEIAFDFECPGCGAAYREGLDLAEFFWREIEAEAKRLLVEVHTLASAYGWRENEVLALSPARRAFYIERVLA